MEKMSRLNKILSFTLSLALVLSGCATAATNGTDAPDVGTAETVISSEEPTEQEGSETDSSEGSSESESASEPTETEPTEPGTEEPSESETPTEAPTEADLPFISGNRVRVTAGTARIRKGPGLDTETVGYANAGAVLDVTGTSGRFYEVEYAGGTGYMHESVVEYGAFEKPKPTEPPATEPPSPVPYVPNVPVTVGSIHGLTQEEINAIRAAYPVNARGYGGLTYHAYAAAEQAGINALPAAGRVIVDNGQAKTVALTFCLGWENTYNGRPITDQALDLLAAYGVKAAFFVTHSYAAHNPAIIRRMLAEGHQVGSHTYSCPDGGIASHSLEDIMNDALRMQQYMKDAFGHEMTLYNYNSGTWSPGSMVMLTKMGYISVLCSASYSDYDANAATDVNLRANQLNAALIPGTIYAFHLTNPATLGILPLVIQNAKNQGYTFTNIH